MTGYDLGPVPHMSDSTPIRPRPQLPRPILGVGYRIRRTLRFGFNVVERVTTFAYRRHLFKPRRIVRYHVDFD